MNTASRLMVGRAMALPGIRWFLESGSMLWTGILFCLLLLSAFSVVYIKDLNRRLLVQYEQVKHSNAHAMVQQGKLLLEQSTLLSQSRIQHLAQKKLHMVVPKAKDIVLVEGSTNNIVGR